MAHLWRAIQRRTSNRKEDETICLSSLLGMDPEQLLDPKDNAEQKMCRFITMLDKFVGIPPGIIFLPGPKVDQDGFGWAPKSWMNGRGEDYLYLLLQKKIDARSALMRHGSLVCSPGVKLHFNIVPRERYFWFTTSANCTPWYRVEYIDETEEIISLHPPWAKFSLSQLEALELIFCHSDPKSKTRTSAAGLRRIGERRG